MLGCLHPPAGADHICRAAQNGQRCHDGQDRHQDAAAFPNRPRRSGTFLPDLFKVFLHRIPGRLCPRCCGGRHGTLQDGGLLIPSLRVGRSVKLRFRHLILPGLVLRSGPRRRGFILFGPAISLCHGILCLRVDSHCLRRRSGIHSIHSGRIRRQRRCGQGFIRLIQRRKQLLGRDIARLRLIGQSLFQNVSQGGADPLRELDGRSLHPLPQSCGALPVCQIALRRLEGQTPSIASGIQEQTHGIHVCRRRLGAVPEKLWRDIFNLVGLAPAHRRKGAVPQHRLAAAVQAHVSRPYIPVEALRFTAQLGAQLPGHFHGLIRVHFPQISVQRCCWS